MSSHCDELLPLIVGRGVDSKWKRTASRDQSGSHKFKGGYGSKLVARGGYSRTATRLQQPFDVRQASNGKAAYSGRIEIRLVE